MGNNLWREYPEDSKAWIAGPKAFVRIEELIRSAGSMKENGILGVLARPTIMAYDLALYTLGIEVPANIMHVFAPFEIYLLAPLTAIFAAAWCIMLVKSRRRPE